MNKIMVVNKWSFPSIAFALLGIFYLSDPSTVSNLGILLTILLSMIGLAVTERLDRIIRYHEERNKND